MTEADIQNSIRVALSEHGVCIFRTNSGEFWQGRRVWSTEFKQYVLINLTKVQGLPKGHSDLAGVQKGTGKAVYIEVKTQTGKASEEQINFIEQMARFGAISGIARSVDDALKIINGGM